MRTLVVEDEVRLARQIASALTEAAHDPVTVHDGESALDRALGNPFDLNKSGCL
jgi:DNA-binding response OmpR family regulator